MDETTGPPLLGGAPAASRARERLEIELQLARRAGRPAALVAVALDPLRAEGSPPDLAERVQAAVEARLRAVAGPEDPPFLREGELLFALLPGRDLEAARALAEALLAEARHLRVPGLEHELRAGLSIGLARDERDKDYWLAALFAVAAQGVEVARSRGGECVSHTELYSLCQRKAERAGPRPRVAIPPELEARALASASAARPAAPSSGPGHTAPRAAPRAPQPAAPMAPSDAPAIAADAAEAPPGELLDAIEARDREHRAEVERLERRIAKLMETLDATERELRELARRQDEGPGVASRYREVQGLAADDERFQLKNALMERILQANLELREILRAQHGATR